MTEIGELFIRDPLKLTKEDRAKIIAKFREDRERFLLGQKAPKAAKAKIDISSLQLDDI